ncbi:MAG TPA: hypothetical protein VLA72_14605 [Anaerolineales bacterium]|nr:hypothetical protein [Anaerolineales bacterium]
MNSPRFLLTLGLILLLAGWITPLLIIMRVIPSTFFLNFLSWGMSVAGLFLGFVSGAMWVKMNRD